MQRENRYSVIKWADAEKYLSESEIEDLALIGANITAARMLDGKEPLECVVVEKDWPEYEPTWAAIESRVDSKEAH